MNALLTLLTVMPFMLAVLLANVAERRPSLRPLLYTYLFLLNGLLMFVGLSSVTVGLLGSQQMLTQMGPTLQNVDWVGSGAALAIGAALAWVALLPAVRRLVARVLPIDAQSHVHATALSMTATVLGGNLFQMGLSSALLSPEAVAQAGDALAATYLDILVFPLLVLSVTALIAVGWLTRRSWSEVVERLGLTVPTLPQLGLAVLMAAVMLGLSYGTDRVWEALDPVSRAGVGGVSSALLGNFSGITGAFAIGITAAVGEELFFRGAYLPRMGLLMSAVLFASFHVQYFLSPATLLILVFGLMFGVLRQRTSLTIAILVHFLYNFAATLLGG
jgi:uncharacterized protein